MHSPKIKFLNYYLCIIDVLRQTNEDAFPQENIFT